MQALRSSLLYFCLFSFSLFGLEITVSKGLDNNVSYSVIDIKNEESFLCQSEKDAYGVTKKLTCSFAKIPPTPLKAVSNEFFSITPIVRKKNFFLIVSTQKKLYAKAIIFDLATAKSVFSPKTNLSKHWIVIGYEGKLPFIETTPYTENTISFPVYMPSKELPFVGGLDLEGNPVVVKNSEDVEAYVRVKQLFRRGKYDDCIEKCDEILYYYPDTLFKSELFYYKIKSFFKLRLYESVIQLSKEYLREFSSDENVPEILLLTAVSFYKNGQYSDADYFFDRLFNEHADSVFAKWGYVYKGDMAVEGGEDKTARKFFNKALAQTKEIKIAAAAAFRLARLEARNGKYEKAYRYVRKILHAYDRFFFENYSQAKELMFLFADAKHYDAAADIDGAILRYMKKRHDDYENDLRLLGIWLAKTQRKQEAIAALDRYVKEFNDGLYLDEIEKTRDMLFFATKKEEDTAKLLAKYDTLIRTYKQDPIGQKALYEKAKLMLKKKMYSDVLQLKAEISALDPQTFPDKENLIRQAALGLMENALQNDQCQVVLDIERDYNITLTQRWDDGLFACFMKAANFRKAKTIVERNLASEDIEKKKKWLYRYAKVDFETGNYSEAIDAANDLLALIDDIRKSRYKDIYRLLFDAYDRIGKVDAMIRTIGKIESLFGLDYKDIDRYVAMINVGVAKKDDTIIIKYGKKLYDLQRRTDSHAQSPFVEFALYQAYMNKERYEEALEVIRSLDDVTLTPAQRARQQYQKGAVLEKLWRDQEAIKAYKAAIKADKNSAWAKLAKSALEIQ